MSSIVYIKLYDWILIGIYNVHFGLLFDTLSSSMIFIICTISWLVHLYSIDYMSHDPYTCKFLSYSSLFTFFMLCLVTADNFMQLFMGREGVGLCSYLLINFWNTRIAANKASLKAMLMNRIADIFLTIGIVVIFSTFKTVDFLIIYTILPHFINEVIIIGTFKCSKLFIISLCLIIGAMGKSAQIGFHTWLADAMEGPTPVSALLHAATMVTAGIYLLLRSNSILLLSNYSMIILIIVGSITAVYAGICALIQYDIKKIIAYSTCSQLGYMFLIAGLDFYSLSITHLVNHAFFKALLFLSAGAIIHAMLDEQDMRVINKLNTILPFIYLCFMIGSLTIMGFPFLTGFYSKDLILEFASIRYIIYGNFAYTMGLIAAILTAIYSTRLLYLLFLCSIWYNSLFSGYYKIISRKQWDGIIDKNKSYEFIKDELGNFMLISMTFLTLCSILIGFLLSDLFIGLGTNIWLNVFVINPINFNGFDTEFVLPWIKNLPIICSLLSLFLTSVLINIIEINSNLDLFSINKLSKVLISTDGLFQIKRSLRRRFLNFNSYIYIPLKTDQMPIAYRQQRGKFFPKNSNAYTLNFYKLTNNFYAFSNHAGFFNTIYNNIFVIFIKTMYNVYVKALDRGFFEYFGPYGLYLFFRSMYIKNINLWYVILVPTLYIIFSIILIFLLIFLCYMILLPEYILQIIFSNLFIIFIIFLLLNLIWKKY